MIILCFLIPASYADVRFLVISDFHYDPANNPNAGLDTSKTLLDSSFKKFNELSNKVDFILTLGDFPTHGLISSARHNDDIETIFHGLYQADKPGHPIFYITGNNDSPSGNYQPFSWGNSSPLTLAKDWQGACAYCEGLVINKIHMKDKGYYSSYVHLGNKNIILIALNTIQFAKLPFYQRPYTNQSKDALQQLQWLKSQLQKHSAKQLLIAMHIPPGTDYKGYPLWHEDYLKKFITLLNRYQQNYRQITLLTAHTHMDDVRKIHLNNGRTIYAYATPSISQLHHNNPGMKIFDLAPNLKLKDYTTFYTITDNHWGNQSYQALKNIFPKCHSASLASCLNTLTTDSFCKIFRDGLFYGVKSQRVDSSVCKLTFLVNPRKTASNPVRII
jgi:alkaline phosphatase D